MMEANQPIAPCGMNCSICMAYLRKVKRCPGCHGDDAGKQISCLRCRIKNCEMNDSGESTFCFHCEKYPCLRLKQLDKRYRTRYSMSMIENLENIKENGLDAFIINETLRWRCKKCGGVIDVHHGRCSACGEQRS